MRGGIFTKAKMYKCVEKILVSMLQQEKIHPRLAFESSGLFVDAERAYSLSMEYYESQMVEPTETDDEDDNTDDIDEP